MSQYVVVYGPATAPVVYTTASPDVDEARMARWFCDRRHPGRNARVTTADAVCVPATSD